MTEEGPVRYDQGPSHRTRRHDARLDRFGKIDGLNRTNRLMRGLADGAALGTLGVVRPACMDVARIR